MVKVKVCGMTDPVNVRDISEAKPDFLGFIFYPSSPRYVGIEPDISIFNNVLPGIKKAGVFIDEKIDKIIHIAGLADFEIIQLHGEESSEFCAQLKASGLKVIKVFHVENEFHINIIKEFEPCCDYFLFDTKSELHGGSGRKFDWTKLMQYTIDKPYFLSGGICSDDAEKIRTLYNNGLYAVDINSRFETSPGMKNVKLVKKFINEIKSLQQ